MMKMSVMWVFCSSVALIAPSATLAAPADEEKKVFAELSALIPKDHFATVDDLYKKWQLVQEK